MGIEDGNNHHRDYEPPITWTNELLKKKNALQYRLMYLLGGQYDFYDDREMRYKGIEQATRHLSPTEKRALEKEWRHEFDFWKNEGWARAFDRLVRSDPSILDMDLDATDARKKLMALGPRLFALLDPHSMNPTPHPAIMRRITPEDYQS